VKLYVSGPMRGHRAYNFPEFDEACHTLRKMRHVPIGPQEVDRLLGFNEYRTEESQITYDMIRNFLLRDMMLIITEAEGIVVLPEWYKSTGALAEIALGQALHLPVYDTDMNKVEVLISGSQRY
jgi:hypothetical protein